MSKHMPIFSNSFYRNLQLKSPYSSYTWYTPLLDTLYNLFLEAQKLHSTHRTLTGRLDFTFPTAYPNSCDHLFHKFLMMFTRIFSPEDQPLYFWVREQRDSEHPHYHLQLWITKINYRSFHRIFQRASILWCQTLNIPIIRGYVTLNRTHTIKWPENTDSLDPDTTGLPDAFRHAVYLAKTTEKDKTPKHLNLYGSSTLKKRNKSHANNSPLLSSLQP